VPRLGDRLSAGRYRRAQSAPSLEISRCDASPIRLGHENMHSDQWDKARRSSSRHQARLSLDNGALRSRPVYLATKRFPMGRDGVYRMPRCVRLETRRDPPTQRVSMRQRGLDDENPPRRRERRCWCPGPLHPDEHLRPDRPRSRIIGSESRRFRAPSRGARTPAWIFAGGPRQRLFPRRLMARRRARLPSQALSPTRSSAKRTTKLACVL